MSEPREPRESRTTIGSRDVRDPRELRALAHPVRLALLEELIVGPATATELSERIGESAANCSWHLRQLARYGFIEEAGGGSGRQRPWRLAQAPHVARDTSDEAETQLARDALVEVVVDRHVEALHRWMASRAYEGEWRDASFAVQSLDWMTIEELRAFTEELRELYERHFGSGQQERLDPAKRPPDARLIRHVAWSIPDPKFPLERRGQQGDLDHPGKADSPAT